MSDMLTPEQYQGLRKYLADGDYHDIGEWGRDSDYTYSEHSNEWYDEHGNPVDLWVQLYHAIEASGTLERYMHMQKQPGKDAALELLLLEEEAIEVARKIQDLEIKRDDLWYKIDRIRQAIATADEFGLNINGGS